jgi:hypothetical protein
LSGGIELLVLSTRQQLDGGYLYFIRW